MEVEGKRDPPDQIIGEAEHEGGGRPDSLEEKDAQPDRSQDFSDQSDGGKQPSAFRQARDLEIENAVKSDHHAEAREDLRMIRQRHSREPEQPLWIKRSEDSPSDVIQTRCHKKPAVKATPRKTTEIGLPGAVNG